MYTHVPLLDPPLRWSSSKEPPYPAAAHGEVCGFFYDTNHVCQTIIQILDLCAHNFLGINIPMKIIFLNCQAGPYKDDSCTQLRCRWRGSAIYRAVIPCLKCFPSIWPWPCPKYSRLKLIYGNTIWILIVASNLFSCMIIPFSNSPKSKNDSWWNVIRLYLICMGTAEDLNQFCLAFHQIWILTSQSRYLFIVLSSSQSLVLFFLWY